MIVKTPRIRWTVGLRLSLVAAAILASLSLFAYLSIRSSVDDLRHQLLNRSLSTSTLVELRLREYLDEVERHLTSFADIPAVRQGDQDVSDEILRDLMFRFPRYANIFEARADGAVIARALWESHLPDNLSQERYFLDAVRTGEMAVSERIVSQGSVGPAVHVAVPLKDYKGHVTGVLGATLSLAQLQYNVTQIQAAESAVVIVADSEGKTLLNPQWTELVEGRSLEHIESIRKALRGEAGYVDGDLFGTGEKWLGVCRPFPRVTWALVVAYPESSTVALVQQAVLRNGLYLAVALLLVIPVLLFVFQKIARELKRLSSEVRAMAISETGMGVVGGGDEFSDLRQGFITMSSQLAAMRVGMVQKADELRRAAARRGRIREDERRRLALEVHDGVAQYVVSALQQAREMQHSLGVSPAEAAGKLKAAQDLLDQAVMAMDSVIFSLRPPEIPEGGLLPALQRIMADTDQLLGLRVVLSVAGAGSGLSREAENAAFRIVQEALNNVRKHSGAAHVAVRLDYGPSELVVTVQDDGCGFDHREVQDLLSSRMGISGMAERAAGLGGLCSVRSRLGEGTTVEARLPLGRTRRRLRSSHRSAGTPRDGPLTLLR